MEMSLRFQSNRMVACVWSYQAGSNRTAGIGLVLKQFEGGVMLVQGLVLRA